MRRASHAIVWVGIVLCACATCSARGIPSGGQQRAPLVLVSSLDAREDVLAQDAPSGETSDGLEAAKMFAFSLVVPGAGQLVQGEKRGYLYILAEVALWGGFYYLETRGIDERDEYERYADKHFEYWEYMDFYSENCCADCPDNDYAHGCRPMAEYGSQEYYEDIGKYDVYWPWWAADAQWDEISSDAQARRDGYWEMRKESNLHLRRARYCAMAALLNHVVSAFDSFLSSRRNLDGFAAEPSRVGLEFEATDAGDGLRCAIYARY